jgi:hypothetical protein
MIPRGRGRETSVHKVTKEQQCRSGVCTKILKKVKRSSERKDPNDYTLLEDIKYTKAELLFNLEKVTRSFQDLSRVMAHVVNSLGKTDPYLIGRIMGTNDTTKWMNENLFYQCRPARQRMTGVSNCGGGRIFSNGQTRKINVSDSCIAVDKRDIIDFSLSSQVNLAPSDDLLGEEDLSDLEDDEEVIDPQFSFSGRKIGGTFGNSEKSSDDRFSILLGLLWSPLPGVISLLFVSYQILINRH